MVHASVVEGGYTPMHMKIAENFPDAAVPGIEELLRRGADPHCVGFTSSSYGGDDSERLDTATSLAMRRSSSFFKWRQIVRDLGLNLDKFVADELEHAPLVIRGWTASSLSKLFELDFEPLEIEPDLCTQCGRVVYHTFDKDETWWEELLDELKASETGMNTDNAPSTPGAQSGLCERDDEEVHDPSSPVSSASTSSTELDEDLCWKCGIMQRTYGDDYDRGRL
ncbi:hypothetical protein BU16DRAFT_245217 [Lophium mytilinum]|uniref:Uncharacterized protein n=1 Tax=Lophium mytilinum TaxID=390894 RepID=A0A6A6R6H8_9PEZI|nr:hypothetical protein BU16DRAFT_245217 [Lophium mytilinum]